MTNLPPLPKLPIQKQQPQQSLPRSPPPIPQFHGDANSTEYPFTIIESDHALKYFNKSIELPTYLEWIPTSKLREFVQSNKLQEGYIKKTYTEQFNEISKSLDLIQNEHKKYAKGLISEYQELLQKIAITGEKLGEYYKLGSDFEEQKIEMYDAFRNLTREAVAERYKKQLKEIEVKAAELLAQDEVDNIDSLIKEYKQNRMEWHSIKHIIQDLETNKILN